MTTREIPAQVVLICDRCGAESESADSPFYYGSLHIGAISKGRTMQGDAAGSNLSFDFCCECSKSFEQWRLSYSKY